MFNMNDTTCKKCGGTGRLAWTSCDGGRCWACTGRADTSYTRDMTNEEANAHAEALRAGMIARRQARRLAVGDVVQYPSGNSGEVVAAEAGVSVQTAHGRDWFSFRDADHILTKVVA